MCDVYGEAYFNQKAFTNELKTWVCHYKIGLKSQSMKWKHTDSLVKKKFRVQQSVKKVMLTIFWDTKGLIT